MCMTCSLRFLSLIFTTAIIDRRMGDVFTKKGGCVMTRVGATNLDVVVAVSARRSFAPNVSGHCPPTEHCRWPLAVSDLRDLTQYNNTHRSPRIVHKVIAGSRCTQCVPPRARDCLVPELDTRRWV
jgi:hypothetical protein